jgi:hypothetical protein
MAFCIFLLLALILHPQFFKRNEDADEHEEDIYLAGIHLTADVC